jgi:phenylacetic acid degradation protein
VPIYAVGGNRPRIDPSAFVHPLAIVMGRVEVGPHCYIGAGAALRGDWVTIRIGAGSNVQDMCVVHGEPGGEVLLAEESHLGHACIVHNARLMPDVMVGMGAVVSDDVELGEGSIVGAGAVVTSGLVCPPRSLLVGVPARIVGEVRAEMTAAKRQGTRWYQELARRCLTEMLEVSGVQPGAGDHDEVVGKSWPGAIEWQPWIEQTELFRQPAGEAEPRQEG